MKDYKCTDCGGNAWVGFSDWYDSIRGKQISSDKESLCNKCHSKRMKSSINDNFEPPAP